MIVIGADGIEPENSAVVVVVQDDANVVPCYGVPLEGQVHAGVGVHGITVVIDDLAVRTLDHDIYL